MSKGHRRSNREAKKPKQTKAKHIAVLPLAVVPGPSAGERTPVRGVWTSAAPVAAFELIGKAGPWLSVAYQSVFSILGTWD